MIMKEKAGQQMIFSDWFWKVQSILKRKFPSVDKPLENKPLKK